MGTDQKTTPSFEEMQAQLSAQMKRQQEGLKAYRVALSQIASLPEQTQSRIVARIDRAVESYADNGGEVAAMQTAIDAAISEETQYLQDISRAGVPSNVTQAQMGATSNEGAKQPAIAAAIKDYESLFR